MTPIFRAIFWGLFLWGLLGMFLPLSIYYSLLMFLGVVSLICLCVVFAWWGFEKLEDKYDA
jgi:hypothetical protein